MENSELDFFVMSKNVLIFSLTLQDMNEKFNYESNFHPYRT